MIHDISKDLEDRKKSGEQGLILFFFLLVVIIFRLVWVVSQTVSNNY